MKKIILLIISLFMLQIVYAESKIIGVQYYPFSDITLYSDGRSIANLFLEQKYSDSNGTSIADAKSLKNCEFCNYTYLSIEQDIDYPVEIIDYNSTYLYGCFMVTDNSKNKDIELKSYSKTNKAEIKSTKKIKLNSKDEKYCDIIPFGLETEIKWGMNSTIIYLNNSASTNPAFEYTLSDYDYNLPNNALYWASGTAIGSYAATTTDDSSYESTAISSGGSGSYNYLVQQRFRFNLSFVNVVTNIIMINITWGGYNTPGNYLGGDDICLNNQSKSTNTCEYSLGDIPASDTTSKYSLSNTVHEMTDVVSSAFIFEYGIQTVVGDWAGGGTTTIYTDISKISVEYISDVVPPTWSLNKSRIQGAGEISYFNVSWTDETGFSSAQFESNYSGAKVNYTMNLVTGTVYNYSWRINTSGFYYWKSWGTDDIGNKNVTDTWYFNILDYLLSIFTPKTATPVSVTPSQKINVTFNISTQQGTQITSGVSWINATIGGQPANISTTAVQSCAGTLNCGAFTTQSLCQNCSQCTWLGAGNYTSRTCSALWGADCGVTCNTPEGDNTLDTCTTCAGGATDEHVDQVTVNSTNILLGTSVNISCTIDPYDSSTEEYIWIRHPNTTYQRLYSGNAPSGTIHTISVKFTPNITGQHWARCITDYDGSATASCAAGSYYDNDDTNFSVTSSLGCNSTGSCASCAYASCANCSGCSASSSTSQQFSYVTNLGWVVNITAPYFSGGLQDLFINVSYLNKYYTTTESDAVNYGDNTPPTWSLNKSRIQGAGENSYFNLSWTDETTFSMALFESNISGSKANYTMNLVSGTTYNYSAIISSAGSYYWKSWGNDTSNNRNVTDIWIFEVTGGVGDDISFTIGYPAEGCSEGDGCTSGSCTACTYCSFMFPTPDTKDMNCTGQNSTVSFYVFTNTGNVNININWSINTSLASGLSMEWDSDADPVGSTFIPTPPAMTQIVTNLASAGTEEIWLFGNATAAVQGNYTYSINSTSIKNS